MNLLSEKLQELLAATSPGNGREYYHRLVDGVGRLLEVTGTLAAEIEPERILETITREAQAALHCERASLYRYDSLRDELYTSVVTKLEINEIRRSAALGVTGFAAQKRQMVNVSDPQSDERWNPEFDRLTGFVTRNILAAPLLSHDGTKLLGVLQLLNSESPAFDDIDEALLTIFCQHAAVALDRLGMVEQLQRQEGIRASLTVARDIQRGFMPRELPRIAGYESATWWAANEAIGGDYCDVLSLKDGRIALAIADVSGHGLGPSLIMASLRAALHALVLEHAAPEVLLNLVGRSLVGDLRDGRFITMILAALDIHTHSLEYANAGHGPALHYEASTGEFAELESTGMPLGVFERPEYPQGWPIDLEPGDIIFLCTDGIVEAMNREGQQFGRQRLESLVQKFATIPLKEMVQKVSHEVEQHFEGDSPPDDLTILALRRVR
jgi:sigma-B regulation protein RsbU (phosphoserine phosphatase)